ncbi:retrovirus-related pol polyprotein from transposon TNT 1-94, partial [Tanacetum coccineum]
MGETQHVNDNFTPIKDTSHVAADEGVFLDNFAGIKPINGADTNGGSNVDDAALHQAQSDGKHAYGSPYNTGVKLFANLFNTDCSKQKVNFRSLVNEEKVETFDTVLPWAAIKKVKHKFEKLMKTDGVFLFKFAAKTGMDQVLEHGPWIIHNIPLILNKWTPSLSLKKDEGHISFARALIEICSVSDLKREVGMEVPNEDGISHTREVIKVEYEWRPPRCTDCKVFGHSHDKCLKRVNLETPSENKDPAIPSNVSCPSTSNSFDALNNMEEGVSSSRNIQEDDPER